MIDALVILFSAGMCIVIAYRAMRLDAVLPWFGPEQATPPAAGPEDQAPRPAQGWRERARAGRGR